MIIYVTVKANRSLVPIQNKVALRCSNNDSFESIAESFFDEIMKENGIDSSFFNHFEYQIFIHNVGKYYQLIKE